MNNQQEKYAVFSLLFLLLLIFTIVVFQTENSFGGGDHFNHFKLARWGWLYPDMLFSHWGKPAFTLLISPFAQLGMEGARLYNVLIGLATAFLTWLLAKRFRFENSWAVIILVVFTPVYFILMFTSLTEITFSFCLVLAIYLFFKEKYIWSAVVLSFLPLVRTEGIVILPLFVAAYALKKRLIAVPFLSVGFFAISFLGRSYYSGFWWLVTDMPYKGSAKDIYGSGSLFHFLIRNHEILGTILGILFLIGMLVLILKWIRTDRFKTGDHFYFLLLITGSFVVYYAAHSYVWWKGMGISLGLIRVIGAVTPLAALTAMAGIDAMSSYKKRKGKIIIRLLLVLLLSIFVYDGARRHRYGFKLSRPQSMHADVAEYLKTNDLDRYKIYHYNIFLAHTMNLDPRDNTRSQQRLPLNETFLNSVPDSSIIVWDAHFGPNEGRMPLDRLKSQQELRELKVFKPKKNFKVLGGHDYQIVVFQKDLSLKPRLRNIYLDFEDSYNSSKENVYKGNKSFKLESVKNYKTLFDGIYQEISDTLTTTNVQLDIAFNHPETIELSQLILVFSLESGKDVLSYQTRDLLIDNAIANQWIERSYSVNLPAPNTFNDRIKIYLWNKGECLVFLDEVKIRLTPDNEK
jgi:hypothetical protein